ncbi:Heme peroxidase, plant/fungal/bacterial [Corchorus olitorius]|uniref:peroxidase n=1 Tax=Corchorus olitorius TaxID=93759 RepID=A0A1R3KDH0_9ROSI|nr:Heme peroxidase, plant/fungal/bacterial [Corchorus olitorius]
MSNCEIKQTGFSLEVWNRVGSAIEAVLEGKSLDRCLRFGNRVGGPSYAVELGRLDGLSSTAASVNGKLPRQTFNLNQLNTLFAAKRLSQNDMIALSGITPSPKIDNSPVSRYGSRTLI